MTRWKASGIHLTLSVLVAVIAFSLLYFLWYPGVFFSATGGDRLFYLLAGIDVVIGPLLTLVVYKHGKKSLKFDLTVIAVLQMAALLYGLNVMLQARPVFVAFVVDRFVAVGASDLEQSDLAQAQAPFNQCSWTGPITVAVELPTDRQERQALMFSSAGGGKDAHLLPKYYRDYAAHADVVIAKSKSLDVLRKKSDASRQAVDRFLAGRTDHNKLGWLPIEGRSASFSAIVSTDDGKLVGILNVDPW